jgi:hypothetical protein
MDLSIDYLLDSSLLDLLVNLVYLAFGLRQMRGGLFRPKLYTNGLSWQAISWYYPFKNKKSK